MTTITAVLAQTPWWLQTLTTSSSIVSLAVIIGSAFVLVIGAVLLRKLSVMTDSAPVPIAQRGLRRDERATATIEFVLVFPIVLFVALLVTQTTLLMGGNLFVHYAAFAATRSAIVQVPSINTEELSNEVIDESGHMKHNAIRAAAVYALLPVAGRLETGGPDASPLISGLNSHFDAYAMKHPNWIDNLMSKRLAYADANTEVKLFATTVNHTTAPPTVVYEDIPAPYTYGPRDPITVRVTHRLNLSVPYVNMIYSDGSHTPETGTGRYTTIEARYTLTNEGVIDELPPKPNIPRTP